SKFVPDNLHVSVPRVSLDAPRFRGSSVEMPSTEGMGSFLVGLFALIALLIGSLTLARARGWVGGASADNWKRGPWPVLPDAVRTREDVVKAFEYLALLRLGRQAGAANHIDIAGQLGTAADDLAGQKRQAAAELARLYEQARYAPDAESLSDTE